MTWPWPGSDCGSRAFWEVGLRLLFGGCGECVIFALVMASHLTGKDGEVIDSV